MAKAKKTAKQPLPAIDYNAPLADGEDRLTNLLNQAAPHVARAYVDAKKKRAKEEKRAAKAEAQPREVPQPQTPREAFSLALEALDGVENFHRNFHRTV